MKKLYFLNEEEKERILKLHESATKKQYLSEDMDMAQCNECGKSDMYEYSDLDEADAGDVGSKALTGAATGAAIAGPAGAVAGAVIGAAYGLIAGSGGSYAGVKKIFDACNASGLGKSTMGGGTLDSISKQVRTAIDGWGTDEDAIKSALGQIATIPDLCAVNKRYAENYPGSTLLDDLDGDIDNDSEWNEYVYQPLLAAKRKSEELGKTAQSANTTTSPSTGGWAGKGDPDRYWNALVAALKSVGIEAKTENPNFMYWGLWVVYKDYNKNGGYPITIGKGATTAYFKFAEYGGKYAGQAMDKINVIMKGNNTPIPWLPLLQQKGAAAGAAVGVAAGTKGVSVGKTTQTAAKTPSPVAQSNVKQVQKLVGVAETGIFDDVTAKAVRTKLGA
jgi:hypothetical protein